MKRPIDRKSHSTEPAASSRAFAIHLALIPKPLARNLSMSAVAFDWTLQARPTASEHKLHSELDQPRVVDRIIHDSKASRLKEGLWRTKLRMVEEVEELSPELEAYPFSRAEGRSLEYGEIKIDDTLLAKAGIYARLVSECERIRLRET